MKKTYPYDEFSTKCSNISIVATVTYPKIPTFMYFTELQAPTSKKGEKL